MTGDKHAHINLTGRRLAGAAAVALLVCLSVSGQAPPTEPQPASLPVSYGIVADNSASLRDQTNYIVRASQEIIGSGRPEDEVFLVRFTGRKNIKRVHGLTRDKKAVSDAAEDFFVEYGQTAVIDAVYESAEYLARQVPPENAGRRRALVLITDGEERDSRRKVKELLTLLGEKKIRVFVIGFVEHLKGRRGFLAAQAHSRAVTLLNQLAEATGGRAYFPKNTNQLREAVAGISEGLRNP
ncbi:MAG: VWA domain-containing protein [Acidobacteriota bacterium]|nr:VWA domain-containing protein [Acidobacteriota bacterium]